MDKPYLIIVTGAPGSGKSTFSKTLSEQLRLPVLSRDELKNGYVITAGKSHDELDPGVNGLITAAFFEMIEKHLDAGISLIAEAAFQHKVWNYYISQIKEKCRLRVLICTTPLAAERYKSREADDSRRTYFHGKADVSGNPYDEPRITERTYHIDTTDSYAPPTAELKEILFK